MKKRLYRSMVTVIILLGAVACGGFTYHHAKGAKETYEQEFVPFVKEWVSDPINVGSCTPSSRYVTKEIIEFLNAKKDRPLRILEIGSGTGVCTHAITQHLIDKKYSLDAVELNTVFAKALRKKFKNNTHVTIHQEDITKWQPKQKYDIIISTLPLNLLDTEVTASIIEFYKKWIVPGGRLSYVEGTGGSKFLRIFMNDRKRASFKKKYKLLNDFKQAHLDKTVLVLRNIPPYYVHHLKF